MGGQNIANPWISDFSQPPFVLEMDRQAIEKFNAKLKGGPNHPHYLQVTEILPEPFVGSLNAPVVLLSNNPGFNDQVTIQGKRDKSFMDRISGNLSHAALKYPLIFLDPEYKGSDWWDKKLHHLIAYFDGLGHDGREVIAKSVLNIVYFPYPSRRFGHRRLSVPSQNYTFQLIRSAMEREAVIIHMRKPDKWFSKLPELKNYKLAFEVLNFQRPVLTPKCPGYRESLAAIQKQFTL